MLFRFDLIARALPLRLQMSRTAKYLLEQIERAKRYAAALSDPGRSGEI